MSHIIIRRNKKITQLQKEKLIQFMARHNNLSYSPLNSPYGEQRHKFLWRKLTEGLNNLGPAKSIGQWKVTWRDLKRNAKLAKLNAAKDNTGWMLSCKQQSSSSADDHNNDELGDSDINIDDILCKETNNTEDIIVLQTSQFSDHQYEKTPCYITIPTSTSQHKNKDKDKDPLQEHIQQKDYTDEDAVIDSKENITNIDISSPKSPHTSWLMKLEERRVANEEKLADAASQVAQAVSQLARAGILNAESSQTMAQATLLLAQNQQTLIDMLKTKCK